MKIYTGYFGNARAYKEAGLVLIGIAVSPPRWFTGLHYKALAPRRDMLRMSEREYRVQFEAILRSLNPHQVGHDLKNLTGGRDGVLLCFESLHRSGEWCHRQHVAEWLNKAGYNIQEWVKPADPQESLSL